METRTFNQIISNSLAKGATKIEIHRSDRHCGCVKPGDIISVVVYRDDLIKEGDVNYACAKYDLCHVFDTPTIIGEILWRNIKTNRCVGYGKSKEFAYAI